jgi:hypothetical protein
MADIPTYGSVGDWNPTIPKKGSERAEQLMATEAQDAKDVLNATNELRQWVGGSGKPPAPYGVQGRKF